MRRTDGPKRRAEAYARGKGNAAVYVPQLRKLLADAWMAGYRSAARARRKIS